MTRYSEVIQFIGGITDWRQYLHGGCYKYYLMLKAKFSEAKCYYNGDHVITKIGELFYDASGNVKQEKNYLLVDKYYGHDFMLNEFKV